MNRTDRLLAIVLELQGRRHARAEDLAAVFETSKRTIYRDISALGQAGVPLISTPGRGYSLMEGYFLPPLSFTTDEATLLLLGGDVMAQSFDAQYRAAAQSASRKIASVLPEKLRAEVRSLRENITFGHESNGLRPDAAAKLQQLRRAILARATVRFRYFARHAPSEGPRPAADDAPSGGAGSPTGGFPHWGLGPHQQPNQPRLRDADPYALGFLNGAWYLSAYCHLRRGVRHFRLDRIEDLTLLDSTFIRPPDFQSQKRNLFEPGSFDVQVCFDAEIARWVREAPSFFTIVEEEMPDGGLLVTLHVRSEDEVLQWLLGWGRHMRVLAPDSLRRRIAAEAAAMACSHAASAET
jgi:predicted DNA-binding transcriptional regulator YafY